MTKRTTVTLDDDVAAKLDSEARKSGMAFRHVLNEALRRGLNAPPPPRKPFKVRSRNLGVRPGVNFDCTSRLVAELDALEKK
jgi:hypothetical protein